MDLYELTCDFDVVRRIPWSGDDLAELLDNLFNRLHQASNVHSVSAEVDLDTGRSLVSMEVSAINADESRRVGCAALGVAIRSCGGVHVGLLPLADEAKLVPDRNQWSTLRSPTWNVRSIRPRAQDADTSHLATASAS